MTKIIRPDFKGKNTIEDIMAEYDALTDPDDRRELYQAVVELALEKGRALARLTGKVRRFKKITEGLMAIKLKKNAFNDLCEDAEDEYIEFEAAKERLTEAGFLFNELKPYKNLQELVNGLWEEWGDQDGDFEDDEDDEIPAPKVLIKPRPRKDRSQSSHD